MAMHNSYRSHWENPYYGGNRYDPYNYHGHDVMEQAMRDEDPESAVRAIHSIRSQTPIPIISYRKSKGYDRITYDFQLADGKWYQWAVPTMRPYMSIDTASFKNMTYSTYVSTNTCTDPLVVPKPKPKKKTNFQLSLKKMFWSYYIRHGKFPMSFINT